MAKRGQYEIKDLEHPEWPGMRFSTLDRAEKEWRQAIPRERFVIIDRFAKVQVKPEPVSEFRSSRWF